MFRVTNTVEDLFKKHFVHDDHLPDAGLQEKSIKKSSSSNAIGLRNKLEGASAEYKRSKYLWDDTRLLIQTSYG